jgi:DNA-binding transcriptional regulator YiaG
MTMYHYTECGLPNVYLKNGFEIVETPYGKGVTIHNLAELHDVISECLVCGKKPLSRQEFKFLRLELELSQAQLGVLLGRDQQSIARWEKGRGKVEPMADRLLRTIYKESKMPDGKLKSLMELLRRMSDEESAGAQKLVVSERGTTWEAKCAEA